MEVEFLSNMRYNLYVRDDDWNSWHRKLGWFYEYFERASRAPVIQPAQAAIAQSSPPLMLSPPVSQHPSPYFPTNALPSTGMPTPSSVTLAPYQPPMIPSPLSNVSDVGPQPAQQRKRSRDESYAEPTAKRVYMRPASSAMPANPQPPTRLPDQPQRPYPMPTPYSQQAPPPQLPMPNVPSGLQTRSANNLPYAGAYPTPAPPSVASRAMSTVYGPNRDAGPSPSRLTPITPHHHAPHAPLNIRIPPGSEHLYGAHPTPPSSSSLPTYGPRPTPNHLHHPFPYDMNSQHGPRTTSPVAALTPVSNFTLTSSFPPTSQQQQQQQSQQQQEQRLSPATLAFHHRNSPYKPVRSVNTLLVPPPSASLHNPPANVGQSEMRYQPLGKGARERKVGVVPTMGGGAPGFDPGRPNWGPADFGGR